MTLENFLKEESRVKLIVGNGFDLNLGLPTKYSDYINSTIFKDLLLKKTNQLALYMHEGIKSGNWVDIESKLIDISKKLTHSAAGQQYDRIIKLKREQSELIQNLCQYIRTVNEKKYNRDSFAFELIKSLSYLNLEIFNFNYTNTLFDLIQDVKLDKFSIINVHGLASENDIIFGVQDSADIYDKHAWLKKSQFPNHTKINLDSESPINIIFFGHSLGQTDHSYFSPFFERILRSPQKHNIIVFYYEEEGHMNISNELDVLSRKRFSTLKQNTSNFLRFDISKQIDRSKSLDFIRRTIK